MTTAANTPDTAPALLDRALGRLGQKIIAGECLLLFEMGTGALAAASDAALHRLGLDLDGGTRPCFADTVGEGSDSATMLWAQLEAGADCRWTGEIIGGLGLTLAVNAEAMRVGDGGLMSC